MGSDKQERDPALAAAIGSASSFQFDLHHAAVYQAVCFPKPDVGGNLNNFEKLRTGAILGPPLLCQSAK